jgi:hypothetical protein
MYQNWMLCVLFLLILLPSCFILSVGETNFPAIASAGCFTTVSGLQSSIRPGESDTVSLQAEALTIHPDSVTSQNLSIESGLRLLETVTQGAQAMLSSLVWINQNGSVSKDTNPGIRRIPDQVDLKNLCLDTANIDFECSRMRATPGNVFFLKTALFFDIRADDIRLSFDRQDQRVDIQAEELGWKFPLGKIQVLTGNLKKENRTSDFTLLELDPTDGRITRVSNASRNAQKSPLQFKTNLPTLGR